MTEQVEIVTDEGIVRYLECMNQVVESPRLVWMMEHGHDFDYIPKPAGVRWGVPRECYRNALHFIWENPTGRYVYVEGYGVSLFPTQHAWIFDRERGEMIDPTWRPIREWNPTDAWQYFGIPLKLSFVEHCLLATKCYSVFEHYRNWSVIEVSGDSVIEPLLL